MTPRKLAELIYVLCEAFRQKATEHTIRAYELGLAGMPDDVITEAVQKAMITCKFMPTIFELRQLAGAMPRESRSVLAWASVQKAIHEVGEYQSVDFDDPFINATIRVMGGWEQLCGTESGEAFHTWKRKQFEDTYNALLASGVGDDLARPLDGICDRENSANGYLAHVKGPVKVVTGLPVEHKRLSSRPVLQLASGIGDVR